MSGRLQGKVCIVTGAASGFGRGIATKFASEGAKVIIADLSVEAGEKAAQELGCDFMAVDVTKRTDWQAVLDKALSLHGQLDIVVNNAGATYSNRPTMEVADSDFDLCFNVNVKSVYLSASVLVPYFLEKGKPGCFVQVASTAGLRPRGGLTWYNASKAAVMNASKSMAVEYGPNQIRFNSVCPVVGSTGMYVSQRESLLTSASRNLPNIDRTIGRIYSLESRTRKRTEQLSSLRCLLVAGRPQQTLQTHAAILQATKPRLSQVSTWR